MAECGRMRGQRVVPREPRTLQHHRARDFFVATMTQVAAVHGGRLGRIGITQNLKVKLDGDSFD